MTNPERFVGWGCACIASFALGMFSATPPKQEQWVRPANSPPVSFRLQCDEEAVRACKSQRRMTKVVATQ